MVNRYDNPAQAEFINTYVPIPFEQLYTLGKQAKENVDKALKEYSTTLDKWADFQSPSAADTQAYYAETYGRALPVAEELARNIDLIKTPEGRSKIYSVINNTDRAKLSMLRQSAEGLKERQKVNQRLMLEGKYNPEWHNVDFTNYNTLTSGIYNDVAPLAYKSIKDLTDKYVNNLKDSFIEKKDGFIWSGVTGDQLKDILNANRSGILATPEAKMHMQMYMKNNPEATAEDAANAFMQKAFTDNQEYIRRTPTVDPYAIEAMRQENANLRAGLKKKGSGSTETPASIYDMFLADAQNNDRRLLQSPDLFKRTKRKEELANEITSKIEENQQQALAELEIYREALANGQITQKQYDNALKQYNDEFKLSANSLANELLSAYKNDVKEIFTKQFDYFPSTQNEKNDPSTYYQSASRTLNILMQPASGNDLNIYNTYKYGNPIKVNVNDIPTDAYVTATSSGFKLANNAVNKLMGVKSAPIYIKDSQNRQRDFAKDFENGVIKNILLSPSNTVMPLRDVDSQGKAKMQQRMTALIPKSSLIAAGYDEDNIDDFFENNFGVKGTKNINVKAIATSTLDNSYGTESSGIFGTKYDRITNTGTDTYYAIDVTTDIRPDDVNAVNWDTVRDRQLAGSTLAKNTYVLRQSDVYSTDY